MFKQNRLVEEVFTPNGIPTVTYVYRRDHDLENQLLQGLRTPGRIISLSGPSKSGKTVLIKRHIKEELLISVSGGAINSSERLWERVLNLLGAPQSVARESGRQASVEGSGSAKAGLSFLAKAQVTGTGTLKISRNKRSTTTVARAGIDQVVSALASTSVVLFIDDFHYIRPEVQEEVCKQIKEAAEKGLRICTASVPHRSDDVVRVNPELRGRVQAIDVAILGA